MSQQSKLKASRDKWHSKASQRATENRYLRKQIARIRAERNHYRNEFKKDQRLLLQQTTRHSGVTCLPKVDLVLLAITLFTATRIGFRAISRVLNVFADTLGIKKVPCPQTVINWVMRLSLVRIQSASDLTGSLPIRVPRSNGLIWMIDMSIGLGTGKILAVLALDANHHQLHSDAPSLQKVRSVAVAVANTWTGETIADFLLRVIAVMGSPAAYLKDGGSDLKKAHTLLVEQGQTSVAIDDISHVVATILKRHYQDHPTMTTFLTACGKVSSKFKQTILACLAPPKIQTKARFMNVHRLFAWADRLLKISTSGRALIGSTLFRLQYSLDKIPECKIFIKRFRDDAAALLDCQKILKNNGLSRKTYLQCEPIIESIPSLAVRRDFTDYLHTQLDTATTLGLADIGMPISSDAIESLFGLTKQHGTGEIKDANRMALRLPALCGIPTRTEAQQVVDMSTAQQNEFTEKLTSLTKQRRDVFSNHEGIEKLGLYQANNRLEIIPGAKNRSNIQKIPSTSKACETRPGPKTEHQKRPYYPEEAAA
ncbi:MAG: hypothetical protein HQM06_17165 [Magnetococcales bacterium]|nr:hypothetical protein [Magnetococcales bacterium]